MDSNTKLDLWGYPVRTVSDECIAFINAFYLQVLKYGTDRKVILKAVESDTSCALAHVLSAAYAFSRRHPAHASSHLAAAESCLVQATEYEKTVFRAVATLVEGPIERAVDLHSKLLTLFPRDLVSLKRVQVLCFYTGRSNDSLRLALQVLPENVESEYMHGMLAFSMLEVGMLEDAEVAARKGLEINGQDSWAQHALCHVLYYKCQFIEAITFMEKNSYCWNDCCSFMYIHNWWHVALCYLEGGGTYMLGKVLSVYDHHIWGSQHRDLDGGIEACLNGLGLLLRLDIRGNRTVVDRRLSVIIDFLNSNSLWNKEWLLDLLLVWAFARSGYLSTADHLLQELRCRVERMEPDKQQFMLIALKLAVSLSHYGRNNLEQAASNLGLSFEICTIKEVGASDEQLDVFEELWCLLSLHSGYVEEAARVLEKRLIKRNRSPFAWRLMGSLHIKSGRTEQAKFYSERADSLESSFQSETNDSK